MNGVIVLNKPAGFTSFDAVAVARGITGERKIGHTGTLDPMATGVLPLLLGKAAKAADLLPDTDKEYEAGFSFGEKYDTGDCTGTLTEKREAAVTEAVLREAIPEFTGDISQIPPMYSAVSVNGKRLYELARKGVEVERKARTVNISRLELKSFDPASQSGVISVSCSKGTYIRTLIEDISLHCGTVGCMTKLKRTAACGFSLADAHTPEELRSMGEELSDILRPVDSLFEIYPAVCVSEAQAARFKNGQGLDMARVRLPKILLRDGDRVRIYDHENSFLGLASCLAEKNELKYLKLFV